MPDPNPTPERLFGRTWRPGHSYLPRLSRARRIVMLTLFVLLCGLIGAYRYFTNPSRVRQQAQDYLAKLTGGNVTVGDAKLSIFEGLQLDNVRVDIGDSNSEDSRFFSASKFLIQYSPAALLQGRVDATRIVAVDPRVRLVEDVSTHRWNYQALARRNSSSNASVPHSLPEISLRNAMVDYLKTDSRDRVGSASIDGQLSQGPDADHYNFKVQSRGSSQSIGPHAEGCFSLSTGQVHVTLWDLQFGSDLLAMLPAQVQEWWQQHGLVGGVKKTELTLDPSAPGKPFEAKIELDNVGLTVQPQELLGKDELQRRAWASQAFDLIRLGGLNQRGFIDHISKSIQATPIALSEVDGQFTFTQDGVDVDNLTAMVEGNHFSISGHYDGYRNDAKASLNLANTAGTVVNVPANPKFINSLPAEVREAYSRFRPQGTCNVSVGFVRPAEGEKPQVTCQVDLLDASFTFDKFPYLVSHASGKITVDHDDKTGDEHLKIEKIRGRGVPGGPNENATLEVDGTMGPFTPAMEVNVIVRAKNVVSEPRLMAAFPPQTRLALKNFDAPGKGELPQFRGNFTCSIHRLPQATSHWDVETAIHLDDASGALVSFPYPLEHFNGELIVDDDHMTIKEAHMKRGDADLLVKGRIDWGHEPNAPTTAPNLRPSLTIVAHNVPIDAALMGALPPVQSKLLAKIGTKGKFDLNGRVGAAANNTLDFAFDVSPRDCSVWQIDDDLFAITNLTGSLKLTPDRLTLTDLRGKRGDADVTAHGEVSWPTNPPKISLVAEAKNLALDDTLFDMLPDSAQKGWKSVQPQGNVDAKITFSGAPSDDAVASAADVAPATQPAENFECVVTPRNLTITPQPAPYRLDGVTGSLTITPSTVTINDLAGHHGSAEVHLSGTGSTDPSGPWDLKLTGAKMLIDDDLKKAVPPGLLSVMQSTQMNGTVSLDFSKLKIWTDTTPTTAPSTPVVVNPFSTAPPPPPPSTTDVDFAFRLGATDVSLNPGVALDKINGSVDFTGSTRLGVLTDLTGDFNVPSMELSGRQATDVKTQLMKRPGQNAMKLSQIGAQMVGGQLAGQIDWTYPDTGPSRYAMALVLRNADVKALTGDTMPDAHGTVSASLSMEGDFNDPYSRRGGGDVSVTGDQLYRIPLVLGLLQVTSLTLPITSPFNDGACKYTIDGTRVSFDQIELRAKEMMISGNGHLDFDTGRVGLSFTSQSNSTWLKVPVVNDLLQGARNELLTIHVRGTIQQPQVSGSSMNTFATTVDEIFKGGSPPADLPPVKKAKPPTPQKTTPK